MLSDRNHSGYLLLLHRHSGLTQWLFSDTSCCCGSGIQALGRCETLLLHIVLSRVIWCCSPRDWSGESRAAALTCLVLGGDSWKRGLSQDPFLPRQSWGLFTRSLQQRSQTSYKVAQGAMSKPLFPEINGSFQSLNPQCHLCHILLGKTEATRVR